MNIITIRTDQPEAEIALYENENQIEIVRWEAHRQLSVTLHQKIADMLTAHGLGWHEVQAIVGYRGPGSFTGLRIGLTVANMLAYSLGVPIVGAIGDDWRRTGVTALLAGANDKTILPEYGAPVHITQPKK